jgi:uncharacterized protein with FMN-binding domain
MNPYETRAKAKTVTAIIAIVVVVGLVVVIEILQNRSRATQNGAVATSTVAAPTSSATPANGSSASTAHSSTSTYKDGTYTADGQYYVPHGLEDIKVTLTVAGGVVTNSSIVNSQSNQDSQRYQEDFTSQYKSSVVGKNLAEIKLAYIAGASDTSAGFDAAVSQIRNQAQA